MGAVMNSKDLHKALLLVGQVSKTNEKLRMLQELAGDEPLASKVMEYCYDPFKRYGVKNLATASPGAGAFDSRTFTLLDNLVAGKLTGHAALNAIKKEMSRLCPHSGILLGRIISKDMGIGIASTTVNKVWPGLIPEAPYMRCALQYSPRTGKGVDLLTWDWAGGVFSQIKEDGMFVNIDRLPSGLTVFTSRPGQPLTGDGLEWLLTAASDTFPTGTQTHGELIVYDPQGKPLARQTGNGIINSVAQGGKLEQGYEIRLVVWDQIPLSCAVAKGSCRTHYDVRFAGLRSQVQEASNPSILLVETRTVYSFAEALEHYLDALSRGLEGTVVKQRSMEWLDTGSGSNPKQVKMKVEAGCSLRVVRRVAGKATGKNKDMFGSLQCRSECGGLEVAISGFTDKDRKDLHDLGDGIEGLVLDVVFNSILAPSASNELYSLFLPRYDKRRSDKSLADTVEQIQQEYDSVTQAHRAAVVDSAPAVKRILRSRRLQSISKKEKP